MADATQPNIRILRLDPKRINDEDILQRWDAVWTEVHELRQAITRARVANQVITVEMMQSYEQARNAERQFFWDNFYHQD